MQSKPNTYPKYLLLIFISMLFFAFGCSEDDAPCGIGNVDGDTEIIGEDENGETIDEMESTDDTETGEEAPLVDGDEEIESDEAVEEEEDVPAEEPEIDETGWECCEEGDNVELWEPEVITDVIVQGGVASVDFASGDEAALSGVEVCAPLLADIACTTTDAEGDYALTLPVETETYLTFALDGFAPFAVSVEIKMQDIDLDIGLALQEDIDAILLDASIDQSEENGLILFSFFEIQTTPSDEGDITEIIQLSGGSVETAAGEAVYLANHGDAIEPDETLHKTSDVGMGVLFNVTPDDYAIIPSHESKICRPAFHWTDNPNEAMGRLRVVAGYVNFVRFICFEPTK